MVELNEVVSKCVNEVGVDVTTSPSIHLLKHISGLAANQAEEVLRAVKEGRIKCRADLLGVKGLGPITFRNVSGFLRISGSHEPLDSTSVHPEQYDRAIRLLQATGIISKRNELSKDILGSSCLQETFASVTDWVSIAKDIGLDLSTTQDLAAFMAYPNPFTAECKDRLTSIAPAMAMSGIKLRRICEIGATPDVKTEPPPHSLPSCQSSTSLKVGMKLKGYVDNFVVCRHKEMMARTHTHTYIHAYKDALMPKLIATHLHIIFSRTGVFS